MKVITANTVNSLIYAWPERVSSGSTRYYIILRLLNADVFDIRRN